MEQVSELIAQISSRLTQASQNDMMWKRVSVETEECFAQLTKKYNLVPVMVEPEPEKPEQPESLRPGHFRAAVYVLWKYGKTEDLTVKGMVALLREEGLIVESTIPTTANGNQFVFQRPAGGRMTSTVIDDRLRRALTDNKSGQPKLGIRKTYGEQITYNLTDEFRIECDSIFK
jgi:hypothetical protein